MEWDLSIGGIALPVAIAFAFAVVAQLVMWRIATQGVEAS